LLDVNIFFRDFEAKDADIQEKLKYNWKIESTNRNESSFNITLNFTNPQELSATSQPELVQVKFNFPEYFQSVNGNPLNTTRTIKRIPKQWVNEVLSKTLLKM